MAYNRVTSCWIYWKHVYYMSLILLGFFFFPHKNLKGIYLVVMVDVTTSIQHKKVCSAFVPLGVHSWNICIQQNSLKECRVGLYISECDGHHLTAHKCPLHNVTCWRDVTAPMRLSQTEYIYIVTLLKPKRWGLLIMVIMLKLRLSRLGCLCTWGRVSTIFNMLSLNRIPFRLFFTHSNVDTLLCCFNLDFSPLWMIAPSISL